MDVFEKVEGVSKIVGVAPSTVKKYYLLFEQEGYKFKRSNEGHVLFSSHDIDLLKELIVLKNQSGMTVQKAVEKIVQHEVITDTIDTTTDITVMTKQVATVMTEISELKDLIKQQNAFMQQQNELIQQQQKYIDHRLEERDRKLMEALRQSQEERQTLLQLAAAQEEKKKGFFARLFGK